MAVNRVLTDEEKETLQQSARFRQMAVWSLKNFASYWKDPADAATKITAVGADRWAKNYVWSWRALADLPMLDDNLNIPKDYTILLKGMNLWDSAVTPFDINVVIDFMLANGKFDELAGLYVNFKTPTPVF